MSKRKISGLYWDKKTGKGSVDKRITGIGRVHQVFKASSQKEADDNYHRIIAEARAKAALPKFNNFMEAATKYLTESTKKSLARDATALANLVPIIGKLPLDAIHQGSIQPYIQHRKEQGVKSKTVDRELCVVRRILVLASRVWRDENNKPWLPTAPLILSPEWNDEAQPYPLKIDEQRRFFQELPEHLVEMALFAVNTGARDKVVSELRWEWEIKIPELGTSIFLVPGEYTKNGTPHLIVLNATTKRIIESRRGKIESHVFGFKGKPVSRIYNSAWKKAWKRAGLPTGKDVLSGPHNLRHTFARRLRSAGIPQETIKPLMHHVDGDITAHYSPAEIKELIDAVERLSEAEAEQFTMLRIVNG